MTFEEWYADNVEYITQEDFKPWLSEAWSAAQEEAAKAAEDFLLKVDGSTLDVGEIIRGLK